MARTDPAMIIGIADRVPVEADIERLLAIPSADRAVRAG